MYYYECENNAGGIADSAGIYNVNLSPNTGINVASAVQGNGCVFTGGQFAKSTSMVNLSAIRTIDMWLNRSGSTTMWPFMAQDGTWGSNQYSYQFPTSTFKATSYNAKSGSWMGTVAKQSSVGLANNTWEHWVFAYKEDEFAVYQNGVLVMNDTNVNIDMGAIMTQFSLAARNDATGSERWVGMIDNLAIWDVTWDVDDAIWGTNSGSGKNYTASQTNFTVSTVNIDGYNIDNFTAIVNGTTYYTTSGSITTNIIHDTGIVDIDIIDAIDENGVYFNKSISNIDTVSDYQVTDLYQAEYYFTAKELLTNNTVQGNFTRDSQKSESVLKLLAGNNTIVFTSQGYYNLTEIIEADALDNTSYTIYDVYNSIINVSAKYILNNATISGLYINVKNHNYSINYNDSTTGNFIEIPTLIGSEWNITLSASNYTSDNAYIIVSSSTYNQTFYLYAFNSIYMNIYNITNGSLFKANVTIQAISNIFSSTNVTDTGSFILTLLTPSDYELRFNTTGYNTINKYVTVYNDSTQNLNVYLSPNVTDTEIQTIKVVDSTNIPVEGAIVWLQRENPSDLSEFITVQESQANYDGNSYVYLIKDGLTYYRFGVIYEGQIRALVPSGNYYTTKTTFINGVDETIILQINLNDAPSDILEDRYSVVYDLYFGGVDNNTIYFDFTDGRNAITGAKIKITGKYLNVSMDYQDIYEEIEYATTGTLNYTFIPLNNTIYQIDAYILYAGSAELVSTKEKIFDIDVFIEKNTGLLYAAIIFILVALITSRLGSLAGGILSVSSLVPLTYFHVIYLPITVITSLACIIIILFAKVSKN